MTTRRVLVSLAIAAVLMGCSDGGSGKATERSPTTTAAPAWRPPAAGTFVRVADIPPPSVLRDNAASMWMIVAQVCREYDATHGTTTSITVEDAADAPNGRPVSDTACIPARESGPPGGSANAL